MKTNPLINRRKAIVTGLAGGGGLLLSGCSKELPPTYGNILRMGERPHLHSPSHTVARAVTGEGIQSPGHLLLSRQRHE